MCLQIDAAAAPSDLPWPSPLPWCKGEVQISMVRAQVSDAPYFQSLAFPSSYMVMNLSVFSIQGDPVNLVCGRRRRQCTFTPPSPPPDPIPRHPSTTFHLYLRYPFLSTKGVFASSKYSNHSCWIRNTNVASGWFLGLWLPWIYHQSIIRHGTLIPLLGSWFK
jgi:hypothetical protein